MKKMGIYLFISLLVLVMSWEYQRVLAASLLDSSTIPEEAIRLRILAHSDHPQDQWLKRKVRDGVTQEIWSWSEELDSRVEAEAQIVLSLDELESIVAEVISSNGFDYPFSVEYGSIPFPTKLYGQQVYPAGTYDGLLITIGAGQGDNWWCVLFPPLCFVDFGTGEVLDPDQELRQAGANTAAGIEKVEKEQQKEEATIEVRFFLVELWDKLIAFF